LHHHSPQQQQPPWLLLLLGGRPWPLLLLLRLLRRLLPLLLLRLLLPGPSPAELASAPLQTPRPPASSKAAGTQYSINFITVRLTPSNTSIRMLQLLPQAGCSEHFAKQQ
jgi:hypothetical protein